MEGGTRTGTTVVASPNASVGQALDGLDAAGDSVVLAEVTPPAFDPNFSLTCQWDLLNRLESVARVM